MDGGTEMKRGEQAEWCYKCKLWLMPVGMGKSTWTKGWVCPTCGSYTRPK